MIGWFIFWVTLTVIVMIGAAWVSWRAAVATEELIRERKP